MESPFLLLEDIAEELRKDFADFKYDKPNSEEGNKTVAPNIWIGHAPPKESTPVSTEDSELVGDNGTETEVEEILDTTEDSEPVGDDPPFVIVGYLEDEFTDTKGNGQTVESKVGILCGVYSKDSQVEVKFGYKDIMNMMDRVYLTLVKKRFWADKQWWREGSITRAVGLQKEFGSIYDAGLHDHPFYGAAIVATFKAAAVINPINT